MCYNIVPPTSPTSCLRSSEKHQLSWTTEMATLKKRSCRSYLCFQEKKYLSWLWHLLLQMLSEQRLIFHSSIKRMDLKKAKDTSEQENIISPHVHHKTWTLQFITCNGEYSICSTGLNSLNSYAHIHLNKVSSICNWNTFYIKRMIFCSNLVVKVYILSDSGS